MAATGASQVKGGNWKIFSEFVKRSHANVYLNTTVRATPTSIRSPAHLSPQVSSIAQQNDKYLVRALRHGSSTSLEKTYTAVLLAAPFHSTSIQLSLASASPAIPPQPYVHLHVTLLTTPNPHARTRFFGRGDQDTVPGMVLTTSEGVRRGGDGAAPPEFHSMSYHGLVKYRNGTVANCSAGGAPEWSVKIFSVQRLEDRWLRRAFGKLGWVYRKEVRLVTSLLIKPFFFSNSNDLEQWDAYPLLPPANSFPPIKLAKGLFYINAFEPYVPLPHSHYFSFDSQLR